MSVSFHSRLGLFLGVFLLAGRTVAGSITMPSADIEGVHRCMLKTELKTTDGVLSGIPMTTNTVVLSPSCTPDKRLQVGIDLEAGRLSTDTVKGRSFVANPLAKAKVNIFSWRRPGGWQKLTAELKVPLDINNSLHYFDDSGIGRWYNYQLHQETPGFAPRGALYFGVDRAAWVLTLGARHVPNWTKHGITTPKETGGSVNFERLLHRFENGAEFNLMLGVNGNNIGSAKLNRTTLDGTGGRAVMSQIGAEWVISPYHYVELVYEGQMVERLRQDQYRQGNRLRIAYRFRR